MMDMNKRSQYNTKQHDEVLEYLKSMKGSHVTASDVYMHLAGTQEKKVGQATVYRQLERLVEEGVIDKYIIDQNTPACFEYIDQEECGEEFCVHGKCLKCGKLFHLHCEEIKAMREHLIEHHGFMPDFHHTVIYGLCEECAGSDRTEERHE